jgi:hypothetical protein
MTSTRLPAEHLLTWTIVDDRGQPVAGAMLTVDSGQYLCDAEGRGDMASETLQRSVVASASRHTTVEAIVTMQAAKSADWSASNYRSSWISWSKAVLPPVLITSSLHALKF